MKQAEKEVHVLTPTRYEAPERSDALYVKATRQNTRGVEENAGLMYGGGEKSDGSTDWRSVRQVHVDVLKMFGRRRVAT